MGCVVCSNVLIVLCLVVYICVVFVKYLVVVVFVVLFGLVMLFQCSVVSGFFSWCVSCVLSVVGLVFDLMSQVVKFGQCVVVGLICVCQKFVVSLKCSDVLLVFMLNVNGIVVVNGVFCSVCWQNVWIVWIVVWLNVCNVCWICFMVVLGLSVLLLLSVVLSRCVMNGLLLLLFVLSVCVSCVSWL